MYTNKQKQTALELYDRLGSITKVVQTLEYPSRRTMYCRIDEKNDLSRSKLKTIISPNIPEMHHWKLS